MRNCIILGSGRSGTSMVAGSLASAGYFMGESHYPPRSSNPKGFFESPDVNVLNDAVLSTYGVQRPYGWLAVLPEGASPQGTPEIDARISKLTARQPFCFKDPRFCYTLPVWQPHIGNALLICVFRHPFVTASSIVTECRTAEYLGNPPMDVERALVIWSRMYQEVLNHLRRQRGEWIFLHYDQVIEGDGLRRLSEALGAPVDRKFPDSQLSRTAAPSVEIDPRIDSLYKDLCELAQYRPASLSSGVAPAKPDSAGRLSCADTDAAIEYHRREDWKSANQSYRRLLNDNPDNHRILNLLGTLLCQTGEFREAVRFLSRAAALKPTVPEYLNNAGFAARQSGMPDDGIEYFRRALSQDPLLSTARNNLTYALIQTQVDGCGISNGSRLSAVITCYESSRTIGQTVMSLLNQTSPPDEIIVTDDGSSKATCDYVRALLAIVERHGIATYFITHDRSAPYRLNTIRNRGIGIASGDLVFLTDGDILLPKGLLAEHKRIHIESQRSLYLFATRRELLENGDIGPISNWTEQVIRVAQRKRWADMNLMPEQAIPSASFKKTLWDVSGGFDEEFNGSWGFDEVELVFRLKFALGVVVTTFGMVYHIPHPAGAGDRDSERNREIYRRKRRNVMAALMSAEAFDAMPSYHKNDNNSSRPGSSMEKGFASANTDCKSDKITTVLGDNSCRRVI